MIGHGLAQQGAAGSSVMMGTTLVLIEHQELAVSEPVLEKLGRISVTTVKRILGRIRQVKHTWQVVGLINEHQVALGETTYGGREELMDPKAVVDYGSLMNLALQRSRTARAEGDGAEYSVTSRLKRCETSNCSGFTRPWVSACIRLRA